MLAAMSFDAFLARELACLQERVTAEHDRELSALKAQTVCERGSTIAVTTATTATTSASEASEADDVEEALPEALPVSPLLPVPVPAQQPILLGTASLREEPAADAAVPPPAPAPSAPPTPPREPPELPEPLPPVPLVPLVEVRKTSGAPAALAYAAAVVAAEAAGAAVAAGAGGVASSLASSDEQRSVHKVPSLVRTSFEDDKYRSQTSEDKDEYDHTLDDPDEFELPHGLLMQQMSTRSGTSRGDDAFRASEEVRTGRVSEPLTKMLQKRDSNVNFASPQGGSSFRGRQRSHSWDNPPTASTSLGAMRRDSFGVPLPLLGSAGPSSNGPTGNGRAGLRTRGSSDDKGLDGSDSTAVSADQQGSTSTGRRNRGGSHQPDRLGSGMSLSAVVPMDSSEGMLKTPQTRAGRRSVSECGTGIVETARRASASMIAFGQTTFEVLTVWSADSGVGRHFTSNKGVAKWQAEVENTDSVTRGGTDGNYDNNQAEKFSSNSWWSARIMMNPGSLYTLAWDLAGLLLIGYDCVMIPMDLMQLPQTVFLNFMTWFTRIFWSANLVRGFFVGYLRYDGIVECRPSKVAKTYMMTWLPLDIFVVAFDWSDQLFSSREGNNVEKVGNTVRAFRMIKTVRLFRMLKAPQINSKLTEFIVISEQLGLLGTIAKIMIFFLWVSHIFACLFYGLGVWLKNDGMMSWVVSQNIDTNGSWIDRYSIAFYWSMSAFCGNTLFDLNTSFERLFVSLVLFVAFVISSSVVGGISMSMTRLQIINSERSSKLSMLRRFLMDHGITRALTVRVQRNAQHAMVLEKAKAPEEHVELLKIISAPVLVEVHYEIHSRILLCHPFFRRYAEVNPVGLRKVCHSAVTLLFLQNKDPLFSALEVPSDPRMYFVVSGKLIYQQPRRPAKTIEAGHWLSEQVLWTKWTHCGNLCASSEARLVSLNASMVQNIFSSFPSDHAFSYANAYVEWLNELSWEQLNDLSPPKVELENMVSESWPLDEDDEEDEDSESSSNGESAVARDPTVVKKSTSRGKKGLRAWRYWLKRLWSGKCFRKRSSGRASSTPRTSGIVSSTASSETIKSAMSHGSYRRGQTDSVKRGSITPRASLRRDSNESMGGLSVTKVKSALRSPASEDGQRPPPRGLAVKFADFRQSLGNSLNVSSTRSC